MAVWAHAVEQVWVGLVALVELMALEQRLVALVVPEALAALVGLVEPVL